jgi:hypothetical protein
VRAPRSAARPQRAVHVGGGPGGRDAQHEVERADLRSSIAAAPSSGWSSAPSMARVSASSPPAMTPCTISGSVPKVGGISEASSTPSRPEVPAPT